VGGEENNMEKEQMWVRDVDQIGILINRNTRKEPKFGTSKMYKAYY